MTNHPRTENDSDANAAHFAAIHERFLRDDVRHLVELSCMRDLDWSTVLYDWLHEFDNGALSDANVDLASIIVALYESNILDRNVEGRLSRMMLNFLLTFQEWGIQTAESLAAEYEKGTALLIPGDSLRAAIRILERRNLIELALPAQDRRDEHDVMRALALKGQIERRWPGKGDGDIWVRR